MSDEEYNFSLIEKKWQKRWERDGLFRSDKKDRPKFYVLNMYPYPSGVLHMGHVLNYTIGDVMVRYKLLRGYNVLSPMGWDSFGLPAENAAIRTGVAPHDFTEKNIAKIFHSARANHSMLLFDEADSLFTKRVSVENAIDRFSNMETNLLLQEIERFEGVCIMTTNLDKNIDDAFARRIQFKIEFPFPEAEYRTAIWKTLIPKECPVDGSIDFSRLGECFELSGGHIKNAVVRAAYRAAAREGSLNWDDFEFAAEQECKNAGKLFRTSAMAMQEEW